MSLRGEIVIPPLLIAIEGIDGAGKSTLAQSLYDHYTKQNIQVVITKEPGGSSLGKLLRPLLQEKTLPRCPKAEFLLFAADRAQHFHDVIIPALQKGALVISDRMADSSLVYQGFGHGLSLETIQEINQWAMAGLQPDSILYLSLSLETALQRLKKRKGETSIFEQDVQFLKKIIEGFDTLYKNRKNVITIDAEKSPEEIATIAQQKLASLPIKQKYSKISWELLP
jgi:dTMP kinase